MIVSPEIDRTHDQLATATYAANSLNYNIMKEFFPSKGEFYVTKEVY
jgi:hypothetical protein